MSASPASAVRHAVRADLDELERSLADAFHDDPMMAWIYPDPDERPAQTQAFMRVALEIAFPHGHVYATGPNAGAAVWASPDVDMFDDAAITNMFAVLGEQIGARAEEIGTGLLSINEHHPHDLPHFYLFILGTVRAKQSGGLGSRLMAEILERCDRQGLGAYLESSNIRNVPFYERHGFHVLAEVHAGGDFVARPMWRDPRS